ncbi:hypothetical protein Tsp_07123 [Trichinella spiralis]|uniref:hypothetical protein n=1 Tax=Trichinella spiralis TaxID=6334 RepID=UPI0001EFBB70|nr:hypothetical protein Tsp_07123 [Trichinella spiralis]
MFRDELKLWQCYRPECMLGKQLRSWQKSTPGSPQHPYTRTDAKGALKDNGNYSAKQVWRSCFTNRRFSVAVRQCYGRDFPELTLFHYYFSCCAVFREAGKGERTGIADAVRDHH